MFLYYIPKCTQVTRELLATLGLNAVLDPNPRTAKVLANGPDGGPGMLLCDKSYDHIPQMHAGEQTWRPAPKRGAERPPYWIGYHNDAKPTVDTIARGRLLNGAAITLHDGTRWIVPKLVEWRDSDRVEYETKLPQILDINDDGQLVPSRVDPKYEDIWNDGWRLHDTLVGRAASESFAEMTVTECRDFACRVLGLNYRVSALEVAMLGLLDDQLPIQISRIAIDDEAFWTALKNLNGRSGEPATDSPSGVERPTQE